MKVLITGGSGLLGKALLETMPNVDLTLTWHKNAKPVSIVPLLPACLDATWSQLDVRKPADINYIFHRIKPDVVIHCAAIGSVDYTKDHYNEVFAVNLKGISHIVEAANSMKPAIKVVYISTNAVYSGDNPPYNEISPREPVNEYGIIKKLAEQYVMDRASHWQIIRPFMLYGWPYVGGRSNWANTIVQSLRAEQPLQLVDDCIWMPTYALDCAEAIWKLLHTDNQIYNVAASEKITLYDFGLKVAKAFDLNKSLITPISSADLDRKLLTTGQILAKRPTDTSYDLAKLLEVGIMLSDIEEGLSKMRETDEL